MLKNVRRLFFLLIIPFTMLLMSCEEEPLAYVYRDLTVHYDEQQRLANLFVHETDPQLQFALTDKITANLQAENKLKTLTVFLQSAVNKNPNSPYNAYLLLRLAAAFRAADELELAAYYFEYIIQNYPDMMVKDTSIHFMCLKNLIDFTHNPAKLIVYYSRLLTEFYNDIDPAQAHFILGQAYEKQGEWHSAIQSYNRFLQFRRFDVIIPGIPDSYGYARKIVDYSSSTKNWTFNTLDELVTTVKRAIRRQDYRTLDRYRSKVNFFAMSWKQELSDLYEQSDFNLHNFIKGSTIKVASSLDPSSTPYEAYLRATGWNNYYIRTWYFYFKKINFPADPAIHGRWEWAGIYYGEKI